MGTLRELHPNPRFTKHLVEKKVFENDPLVVVDVGARKGFEKHWNHYEDQINLIGFEPNEESFKECVEKKSNKQTTYYHYALDKEKGEKEFYISAYLSACGFYMPDKNIVERFGSEDALSITQIKKIKTIDLDSFSEEHGIQKVDFIKLDTEGSELDILKGSEKTLKNSVLGLSIEVEFLKMYIDQPLFSDIDQYLRSLNFELYDLDLNRKTRKSLSSYASANIKNMGQVVQGQALYLRDVSGEMERNEFNIEFWSKSRILKMTSIQELFYLPDCAIELFQKTSHLNFFDREEINLWTNYLTPDMAGENLTYEEFLKRQRITQPRIEYYKKGEYSKIINILPWPIPGLIRRLLLRMRDLINLFL